jgi:hypothetical protein
MVRGAPKFTHVAGSHANRDGNTVDILFDAVDDNQYKIELDPYLVPALVMAIAGHANELAENTNSRPVQALPVKGLTVSMAQDGAVGLMLHSESGLKTVFSFRPDQAPELRAILGELDEYLSRHVQ